jgi:predicted RNA polymerase sigma factor
MPFPAAEAVEALYRSDWGRIVATLIRLVGDFDLAEEVAQEAFAAAVDQWREAGVPEFPRAWVIQTARHKALDRLRRRAVYAEKLDAYASSPLTKLADEPDLSLCRQRNPRRSAPADLHLLSSRARARSAGRADAPHALRPRDR